MASIERSISLNIACIVLIISVYVCTSFSPRPTFHSTQKLLGLQSYRWLFKNDLAGCWHQKAVSSRTSAPCLGLSRQDTSHETLRPRIIPIDDSWNITVYELQNAHSFVDGYWLNDDDDDSANPFGYVAWPGSVVAAQELKKHQESVVQGKNILVLGAGVGIEVQAAVALGAKHVIATDVNPNALELLDKGIASPSIGEKASMVQSKQFDISQHDTPLPEPFDVMVVADVLYDEDLVAHVARRCREASPRTVLVTDSQNFVDFPRQPEMESSKVELESFTGSGVVIEEDQTYDVDVTVHWVRRP